MWSIIVHRIDYNGSRVHEQQLFCVSRVTKQIFTFSRFSKIEVVQNVKNVTLVPFCKTECFDGYLSKLTGVLRILWKTLPGYKFPREASFTVSLSPVKCEVTSKDSKVKLNQATRCWLRSFGQINELFSSIDLQCTCKQSRILAVQVSRSAPQSRFTEQFFSTSLFTDSKIVDRGVTKISLPPSIKTIF